MKKVSYVMRKVYDDEKGYLYILKRYTFNDDKLLERFWVNTFYDIKGVKNYFDIIKANAKYYKWKIINDLVFDNIWEFTYSY